MAVLTIGSTRQPVATHGNGSRLFEPLRGAAAFASGCHLYGGGRGAKVRLEVRGVVAGDDRGGPAL
jgi:hypothetical protein